MNKILIRTVRLFIDYRPIVYINSTTKYDIAKKQLLRVLNRQNTFVTKIPG